MAAKRPHADNADAVDSRLQRFLCRFCLHKFTAVPSPQLGATDIILRSSRQRPLEWVCVFTLCWPQERALPAKRRPGTVQAVLVDFDATLTVREEPGDNLTRLIRALRL